jgi:hypothetical protein
MSATLYSRAEAELAAIEAERAALPADRPLLFFADAAGKELSQLRDTLKIQADKAREDQHLLRVSLQASRQNEERAVQEATMLARQLDDSHHELQKAKQAAQDAALRSETVTQEINMIKEKAQTDKMRLQDEFDQMRKATNESITEASTAALVKEEAEAKLRNIMDGATVKEKELEVALFNSVHECAQVKKEHQDSMDEMAVALAHQRKEFEAQVAQQKDEFSRTTHDLELRIQQLIAENTTKQDEVERLEKVCNESAHESTKRQLALANSLSETKEGLGRLAAEAEADKKALQSASLEARMTKRETESALREAVQERTELEERIQALKVQNDHQAKMFETKLDFAAETSAAKMAMMQREYEAKLTMAQEEANANAQKIQDLANKESAMIKETSTNKRRELEGLLRDANRVRQDQEDQIAFLERQVTERDEASKKLASTTEYQLTAGSKSRERSELEKEIAQQTAQKTLEESEMTRRVLEAALRESDAVAKGLREELEQLRRDSAFAINDARMQTVTLGSELEDTTRALNQLAENREGLEIQSREQLLAQSKVTERVQLELASARREMDRARSAKAQAMEQASKAAEERDMVAADLGSTRRQLGSAVKDLESSERRSQAIHREKLETVSRLRGELLKEREEAEKIAHEKELAAIDLRRAADDRENARKELATTMRINKQLAIEKEEAQLLSQGLKYRMSEVSAGQEQLLSGTALASPRYHPTGSRAADLSPRLHDPRPNSRYYA